MLSLSPATANPQTNTPLLVGEFLFARLNNTDERPHTHPVIADLWRQVLTKFWYCGDPKAGALIEAVYAMSRCASFRVEVRR